MTRRCVLVTGAGGFIGRWAVPPLLARGFEVHAVAGRAGRAGPKPVPPELAGAQVRHLDLFDVPAVLGLMRDIRPSHLLHFAWVATPGLYWTSPDNARWLAASPVAPDFVSRERRWSGGDGGQQRRIRLVERRGLP